MSCGLAQKIPLVRFVGMRPRAKAVPTAAALLLLAGCAGVKIDHIAEAPIPALAAPSALVVDVALSPDVRAHPAATKAAMALQADLVKLYRKNGIRALPAADAPPVAGAAVMHLRISRADPGNRVARMIVGFGVGRSTLRTAASLEIVGEATPALSFFSSVNSGRKPGLSMPGAIAAATGNLTHLAIGGGLDLLFVGRSGLEREADQTAKVIVHQTRDFYRSAGWDWQPSNLKPS